MIVMAQHRSPYTNTRKTWQYYWSLHRDSPSPGISSVMSYYMGPIKYVWVPMESEMVVLVVCSSCAFDPQTCFAKDIVPKH